MLEIVAPTIAALLGLAIGSFLNVVIYRVPRAESVVFPASRCTSCGHVLAPFENVPVVSWLVLRGRCRRCRSPISPRYALVELMTAALFCLCVAKFGVSLAALAAALLSAYLIVTVFVDIDHLLILDALTLPVAIAGLMIALASGRAIAALEGAALGALLFGSIYLVTKGAGLGLGDVKLAACLGIFLGFGNSIAAFATAFVIGAIVAIPVLAMRKRRGRDVLPFGPFIVLGALILTFAPGLVFGPYAAYQEFLYRRLGGG
ncbi:MAG: prepilin peptidase [Candidatus Eremiobacteraeota bacterium]|nr:prepilin peptidase [Candidatus Eremiobacteraeota bacterium]